MEERHQFFMQRVLELALRGKGKVAPNPLVGSVIVKDGKVLAEGWHQKHGEAHAEINAIKKVANSEDLNGATMYINLEPCSHQGLTPPCAPALAQTGISEFVIGSQDPNPAVQGKGIEILKQAGKKVSIGILEEECREVNRRFFTFHIEKRPYIILKWAQTLDRFIARANMESKWISNDLSRKIVHKWRSENAAILVGNNTAEHDNPQLNTRDWKGKSPVRIIIDRKLSLSSDLRVYTDEAPTLTYNLKENRKEGVKEFIKVQALNFIEAICKDLYERNVQSIMVEGGSTIHSAFIEDGLWDEARIFQSNQRFGTGIAAPNIPGTMDHIETILDNQLLIIKNDKWQKTY